MSQIWSFKQAVAGVEWTAGIRKRVCVRQRPLCRRRPAGRRSRSRYWPASVSASCPKYGLPDTPARISQVIDRTWP